MTDVQRPGDLLPMAILEFKAGNFCYSNFYRQAFVWRGLRWATSEHPFQAMKSRDPKIWQIVQNLRTPREAKAYGRQIVLREDWENVKLSLMYAIVYAKFSTTSLGAKLVATGDAYLSEGNWHRDDYWGYCFHTKQGQNHLGRILMLVRDQLRTSLQPGR